MEDILGRLLVSDTNVVEQVKTKNYEVVYIPHISSFCWLPKKKTRARVFLCRFRLRRIGIFHSLFHSRDRRKKQNFESFRLAIFFSKITKFSVFFLNLKMNLLQGHRGVEGNVQKAGKQHAAFRAHDRLSKTDGLYHK